MYKRMSSNIFCSNFESEKLRELRGQPAFFPECQLSKSQYLLLINTHILIKNQY